jgi:hypothetical protein
MNSIEAHEVGANAAARFGGLNVLLIADLGLTPQALC